MIKRVGASRCEALKEFSPARVWMGAALSRALRRRDISPIAGPT
jgi:hypothetical protein